MGKCSEAAGRAGAARIGGIALSPQSGWPPGPARPIARPDEVHVWRVDLPSHSAGPVLHEVLARYLGEEPGVIELRRGEWGKPALAEQPARLAFNLTHSGELALVAVTAGPAVGVDVERTGRERDFARLAARALAPDAAGRVAAAAPGERARVFYREWTRHEAHVKCLGGGVLAELPDDPVAIAELDAGSGYAAAVAVAGEAVPALRTWSLR